MASRTPRRRSVDGHPLGRAIRLTCNSSTRSTWTFQHRRSPESIACKPEGGKGSDSAAEKHRLRPPKLRV
jgi:hypothetical protein